MNSKDKMDSTQEWKKERIGEDSSDQNENVEYIKNIEVVQTVETFGIETHDCETEGPNESSSVFSLEVIQQNRFVEAMYNYQQFTFFYEAGLHILKAKLQILQDEFKCTNDRNPIESISSRIKSLDGIVNKMKKKNLPFTPDAVFKEIHDIAGLRVICPFISDVYHVANMLLSQEDIELIERKDYIAEPKESGYRSLHLIVNVEVFFSNNRRKVPVEIQIRTISMDCWATLEHQLRYKKDHEFTEQMNRELKRCADQMADSDRRMQQIASSLPSFFSVY